jgi:hypothetical protein
VGTHTYDEGTVVPLSATPDAGWVFDHWSGDVTGSTNPIQITMNGHKRVDAVFTALAPLLCTQPDPPNHDFGMLPVGAGRAWSFDLKNCGGGVLNWNINVQPAWLTLTPTSGSLGADGVQQVAAVIDTTGLPPGDYTGTFNITSNGGERTGRISFTIAVARLCVDPDPVGHDFGTMCPGETATWSFVVRNCGEGVLHWSFRTPFSTPWLIVQPTRGMLAKGESIEVKVVVDTGQLSPKPRYRATFIIASNGGSKEGVFSVVVGPCPPCDELNHILESQGWQLLSLPGEICGDCVTQGFADLCCALCDDLSPCYIVYYDTGLKAYSPLRPCHEVRHQVGMGFWAWGWNGERIDAELRVPLEPTRIVLKKGWNQVGIPFNYPVALDDIVVIRGTNRETLERARAAGWIGKYLFLYGPEVGYQGLPLSGGLLEPWEGYWIEAFEDCELLIPNKRAPLSAAQALVAEGELRQQGIDLPPAPPPPVKE